MTLSALNIIRVPQLSKNAAIGRVPDDLPRLLVVFDFFPDLGLDEWLHHLAFVVTHSETLHCIGGIFQE